MMEKISVIIPVYNTERYLEKCLDSVINQTYKNIEIIIVNDASPDNSQEIINRYMDTYDCIKSIKLKKNGGLYHARLAGLDYATGDYIAFLDSDDYLGIDAYRALLSEAIQSASDIVMGNIVVEWEVDGRQEIHSYNEPYFKVLEKEAIIEAYLDQEGYCFFWYAVWNKLYHKKLFDKARIYLDRITEHTIMAEDVAFSSVLYAMAERMSTISYHTNYYLQSTASSTVRSLNKGKYIKNIKDVCRVLSFVEEFVHEHHRYKNYVSKFNRFKEVFILYWESSINTALLGFFAKKSCLKLLKEESGYKKLPNHKRAGQRSMTYGVDRSFMYSQTVAFDNRYESLLEEIVNHKGPIVIPVNQVLYHSYLTEIKDYTFYLAKNYGHILSQEMTKRVLEMRMDYDLVTVGRVDYSLDDFYMGRLKGTFPVHVCQQLMNAELGILELFFEKRVSILQVIEMAYMNGKELYFQYDFYYERILAEQYMTSLHQSIQIKGGKILVISGLEKMTNETDKCMIFVSKLRSEPKEIKANYKIVLFPCALDVFKSKTGFMKHHLQYEKVIDKFFQSDLNYLASLIAANTYFDNPFKSYDTESDYNKDVYLLGLFPIALYMMGIIIYSIRGMKSYKNNQFYHLDRIHHIYSGYFKSLETTFSDVLELTNIKDIITNLQNENEFIMNHCDENIILSRVPVEEIYEVYAYILGGVDSRVSDFYSERLINKMIEYGLNTFFGKMNIFCDKGYDIMEDRIELMAYPMDYMVNESNLSDIRIFDYCSLYREMKRKPDEMSLFYYWSKAYPKTIRKKRQSQYLAYYPFLQNKPRIIKVIGLLIMNPKELWRKLKLFFGSNRYIYKSLRFVENLKIQRGRK